jgi:iron complex transport system substrate-binding protein
MRTHRTPSQKAPLAALLPILLAALVGACAPSSPRAPPLPEEPRRIVSMNPCADALLQSLADPSRIAAISHYSQDPRATSVPIEWARQFRATGGTAEEVIGLSPDLVIAGPHVALPTVEALARLGIPLLQLPVANSVEESLEQVALVGDALGEQARAERLAGGIRAAVAAAAPPDAARPSALIWQGGGLVPGQGTLADDLLSRAGLSNLSREHGLAIWDVLGLERLVAMPPKLLLAGEGGDSPDRMLQHPATARLADVVKADAYPGRLLHCAGPTIIAASARLAEARKGLRP